MMNILNDDPETLQVSEVPSESSVKDRTGDHKTFSPWYHCGFISWERDNDENFSLKGGLVIGHIENYSPILRHTPLICLPLVISTHIVLIRR